MSIIKIENIKDLVLDIGDEKVLLDSDIADLYKVETKRINEAVKNNLDKFPDGYIVELTKEEWNILKSKFSTSSWGGRRKSVKVFTEQGVYMLATILKSKIATDVTVANHDDVLGKVIQAITEFVEDTETEETKKVGFVIDER